MFLGENRSDRGGRNAKGSLRGSLVEKKVSHLLDYAPALLFSSRNTGHAGILRSLEAVAFVAAMTEEFML
jgi:hypothetical protein